MQNIEQISLYFSLLRNQYNLILIPIICVYISFVFYFKNMHPSRYLSFSNALQQEIVKINSSKKYTKFDEFCRISNQLIK